MTWALVWMLINPRYNPALDCLALVVGIKYWPRRQRVVCPDCADREYDSGS
jgi:hypothetical protein